MINEVYNIDCMEYMKTVPDNFFDLAIVDPPYGISVDRQSLCNGLGLAKEKNTMRRIKKSRMHGSGKLKDRAINKFNTSWDSEPPKQEYFDELFRVSKNQIIWGGNYFNLPPTRGIVCWDKDQSFLNFSQWEMAWTSFDTPAKIFRFSNRGFACPEKGEKIHPTQKPVALYKWLLATFGSGGGGLVLDTHVGSGSIRIACDEMGYDFVGCEIDKDYWEAQEKRYAEWKKGAGSQLQFGF